METDKDKPEIEESPEENNIQIEDHADKFSDQEDDDDFHKIQIDNFKKKTAENFHKNILLIDEKGRQIRSAKFPGINTRNLKSLQKSQTKNAPNIKEEAKTQLQINNNSSGHGDNSTTVMENGSTALRNQLQEKSKNEEEKKEENAEEKKDIESSESNEDVEEFDEDEK